MLAAVDHLRDPINACSFASFCGYRRDGREEALGNHLTEEVGHGPDAVHEIFVGDLLPEADRWNPPKVSRHRVTEVEFLRLEPEIDAVAAALRARDL
jgi:hypothetical protein